MNKKAYITLSAIFACIGGIACLLGDAETAKVEFLIAIWVALISDKAEVIE